MNEPIIFADGECPKCGSFCGNGGSGPLRCECGWVGGIDPDDVENMKKLIEKLRNRKKASGDERA